MPAPVAAVGLIRTAASAFGQWFVINALPVAAERLRPLLADPTGTVQRLADLVVWRGEAGQKVIGLLGGISESQARIEGAVERIETAQIGMSGTLDTVLNLSLFHIGFGALSAGFMLARLAALRTRLDAMTRQLTDIQDHLGAMTQAVLENGLTFLKAGEKRADQADLRVAFEKCNEAAATYRVLVNKEISGPRRLPVLNHAGRCYLIAVLGSVRCLIRRGEVGHAEEHAAAQKEDMSDLARTTFELVLGKNPEVYLEPGLQTDAVTLDVLTGAYQQAHLAGAVGGDPVRDAGDLFERLRDRVYGASKGVWFTASRTIRRRLLTNLKFLIAVLEDVNRVEAVRLRLVEARSRGADPEDLDREAERLRPSGRADGPVAYAFTDSI
jgi:hypothetical protein